MGAPVQRQAFPRATEPHIRALAAALVPLFPAASIHVAWADGAVTIKYPDFAGIDLAAVQIAIDAAPDVTPELLARDRFDDNPMLPAVVEWVAGKLGVPAATARNEVLAAARARGL